MKNLSRNTAAVLVITLFTGLAVFSAVQLGGRLFGTSPASAQTIGAARLSQALSQTQGQTGDDDEYDYGRDSGSQDSGRQGYSDPYGQGVQGTDSGQTYTCPATGCTASSCHATQ